MPVKSPDAISRPSSTYAASIGAPAGPPGVVSNTRAIVAVTPTRGGVVDCMAISY